MELYADGEAVPQQSDYEEVNHLTTADDTGNKLDDHTYSVKQKPKPQRLQRINLCRIITIVVVMAVIASLIGLSVYLAMKLSAMEEIITKQQADYQDQIDDNNQLINGTIMSEISSLRDDMQNTRLELIANISIVEEKLSELHNNILEAHPTDCQSVWETGERKAGVYRLSPIGVQSFTAWCEFDSSHGWTVIQRRLDGTQDFFLYWSDYKNGFGNIRGEYWLGNDNIYALTRQNRQLSIFLQKYDGYTATANYSTFYISSEENSYKLTISGYSGDADDALAGGTGRNHNGASFSTRDRDNDVSIVNCAEKYTGAWWYHTCHRSNLNGLWTNSTSGDWGNIAWDGNWRGGYNATIHRTTMRITRN